MIIGVGLDTKIIWFDNAYRDGENVCFIFKSGLKKFKITLTPKLDHEVWLWENVIHKDVVDFMHDIFNRHFMNDPIDHTKYLKAFSNCIRVRRKITNEYQSVIPTA